jgi:hypothetical protein
MSPRDVNGFAEQHDWLISRAPPNVLFLLFHSMWNLGGGCCAILFLSSLPPSQLGEHDDFGANVFSQLMLKQS